MAIVRVLGEAKRADLRGVSHAGETFWSASVRIAAPPGVQLLRVSALDAGGRAIATNEGYVRFEDGGSISVFL
jgi:hypothetical protein